MFRADVSAADLLGLTYTMYVQNEEPKTAAQDEMLRVCVQMVRTNAKFMQRMHRVFSRCGLSGPQFDVLATLHREEGMMQQELAARLLVTKGNVTGVVNRMEALGWIERRLDLADRRTNRLYLTEAGKSLLAEVNPKHDALIHEVLANFPPDEVQALRRLLRKLEDAVEK
jgi:DNA-binding MarR family transcriptional regulator